ncbi:Hypothetical_protein [Hexamita inflata]|uniref:Hypothetical_protein n=1 Tax=Hexamita inflata TaxID=28002 RepID=A0AA86TVU6_9EUKA|nr:Hypothetical protein HINF_LOCUS16727 [Hexamita inflata]
MTQGLQNYLNPVFQLLDRDFQTLFSITQLFILLVEAHSITGTLKIVVTHHRFYVVMGYCFIAILNDAKSIYNLWVQANIQQAEVQTPIIQLFYQMYIFQHNDSSLYLLILNFLAL